MSLRFILWVVGMQLGIGGCHRRIHPLRQDDSTTSTATPEPTAAQPNGFCCGGAGCEVSKANVGHDGCVAGAAACKPCASGLPRLDGACNDVLRSGESWELHAAYVSGGAVPSMCSSERRFAWACLRSSVAAGGAPGAWTCLPLSECCGNTASFGRASLLVSTEDLTKTGLDIELRNLRPDGPVLARRLGALYATTVNRQALCIGLKFDKMTDISGTGITSFAYVLTQGAGP